jgi:hypothetical protein
MFKNFKNNHAAVRVFAPNMMMQTNDGSSPGAVGVC